jgi:N-acylneuraminate cytidylyltransferase
MASTEDVLREVLAEFEHRGSNFDLACCIYPVAALLTSERLREGCELLRRDRTLLGVITVVRFGFPIQRALRIAGGRLVPIDAEKIGKRSQDLEPSYHDAGQFYWFRVPAFLECGSLYGPPVAPLVLQEEEAQDIDNEDDWRLAELKFTMRCKLQ